MNWVIDNINMLLSILLVISELAAAITQLIHPQTRGFTGFLAGFIKIMKKIGVKDLD